GILHAGAGFHRGQHGRAGDGGGAEGDAAGHAHRADQLCAYPGDPVPASPWLCDRLGTRRVFGAAIVVFGLGSLLCGLAQTLPQLVAARVLQGIGGASLMPVGRYVLVRSIDKREFVRAMSTVATFGLLGSVLGPLL